MATPIQLYEQGHLAQLDGGLDDDELPERIIYACPQVVQWIDTVLPNIEPFLDESRASPMQQLDHLLYEFISGAELSTYKKAHAMTPLETGVWELKTPDLRIFGWFHKNGIFIAGEISTAVICKSNAGAYAGFRTVTAYRRTILDLDEPKFITGDYKDVLQTK
ncbi:hypothetical protein [Brucella anthropi]|uniref:hypothetical protein n=1 Tax=Brucella anthropi TaxID=529 RepID=UPI00163A71B6|nr:hypothetical protein [Brucella anthropi]